MAEDAADCHAGHARGACEFALRDPAGVGLLDFDVEELPQLAFAVLGCMPCGDRFCEGVGVGVLVGVPEAGQGSQGQVP